MVKKYVIERHTIVRQESLCDHFLTRVGSFLQKLALLGAFLVSLAAVAATVSMAAKFCK